MSTRVSQGETGVNLWFLGLQKIKILKNFLDLKVLKVAILKKIVTVWYQGKRAYGIFPLQHVAARVCLECWTRPVSNAEIICSSAVHLMFAISFLKPVQRYTRIELLHPIIRYGLTKAGRAELIHIRVFNSRAHKRKARQWLLRAKTSNTSPPTGRCSRRSPTSELQNSKPSQFAATCF